MKTPTSGSQPFQVVWAGVARVDLHSQHVPDSARNDLDIRNEAWADRIGDKGLRVSLPDASTSGHAEDVL